MGVYIKGMEMPDRCGHCRFATAFDCVVDGQFIKTHDARRKDCPLTPVPPHGGLIERKAISLTDFEIVMCDGDYKEGMKMLLEKIGSAPTIIPAESETEVPRRYGEQEP